MADSMHWTTGGDGNLIHVKVIARGGYGTVHEVFLLAASGHVQLNDRCTRSDPGRFN